MNYFSFWLIVASAVLFGYVFGNLLEEMGIQRKRAYSWPAVFGLAFLAFVAYWAFPIFTQGAFVLNDISGFSTAENGVFLWFAVGLFLGGAGRMEEIFIREQRKTISHGQSAQ